MKLNYGSYSVETSGNGFTALIRRNSDKAEVFTQGMDSADLLDGLHTLSDLNASTELTDSFLSDYFN